MTELSARDRDDPAQRLDSAIERLLAGADWRDLAPADGVEAEEFEALMRIAGALRAESQHTASPGSEQESKRTDPTEQQ